MSREIKLPPLGHTADEMSIVEWYKKVGDRVAVGEPLLCVETDKAQVDVESAEAGVLLSIEANPGDLLPSGTLIAWVGEEGETAPDEAGPSDLSAAPSTPGTSLPTASTPLASPEPSPSIVMPVVHSRPRMAPAVRKWARENEVDVTQLMGTGPGGLIQRVDVEAAARRQPVSVSEASDTFVDVPPTRRVIARRLTESVRTIPSFTLRMELDATAATRTIENRGDGLTVTHVLLRAMAQALREHPAMARVWVDDGPRFRVLTKPDIGLAVASDDSLVVVSIHEPDQTSLSTLVTQTSKAVARARSGRLSSDDQRAVAMTLSNLGMYGVDGFDAIIDPDQSAILAAGRIRSSIVASGTTLSIVPTLSLSLTCDHRVVDGAHAAAFLRTLKEVFEVETNDGRRVGGA